MGRRRYGARGGRAAVRGLSQSRTGTRRYERAYARIAAARETSGKRKIASSDRCKRADARVRVNGNLRGTLPREPSYGRLAKAELVDNRHVAGRFDSFLRALTPGINV